uniref:4F2 cell-surface antigen heavy chain n=1 Tax=Monopterus albus TaxID=43700 RepID=UPI0009B3E242|nr:4F2 cell-surface antigen heavy chain-like [Monopterus albus]
MERSDKAVVGETNKTPSTMNEGDAGYGSVPGRGQPGSAADSETAPLLSPEPGAEPGQQRNSLTKEEVEVVAGGPRWRRLRCYLVVVFWLILVAILAAAITIILLSPRPVVTPLKWWQKSLFYRVQPALFTEAHTRGSGDMNALCEQFPYLKSLGVGTLILEGLFEEATPLNASGTGERYGMLRQIQHLITESNKTGLKMVLDLCELNLLGPDDVTRDAATVQHALRFCFHFSACKYSTFIWKLKR